MGGTAPLVERDNWTKHAAANEREEEPQNIKSIDFLPKNGFPVSSNNVFGPPGYTTEGDSGPSAPAGGRSNRTRGVAANEREEEPKNIKSIDFVPKNGFPVSSNNVFGPPGYIPEGDFAHRAPGTITLVNGRPAELIGKNPPKKTRLVGTSP